jgi:hypothetical protein
VPQAPKVALAEWAKQEVVQPAMRAWGLSKGSPSPDSLTARPYALAIASVVPLAALVLVVGLRTRLAGPFVRWAVAVLALAALDFCCILRFAGGPGFTIF